MCNADWHLCMLSSNNVSDVLHCLPAKGSRNIDFTNAASWPASIIVFARVPEWVWAVLVAQLHALSVHGVRIVALLNRAMLLYQSTHPLCH
jgi:hypothetical protein